MDVYKVRDIMTVNPMKIDSEKTGLECARVMRDKKVGSLLVTTKNEFSGIITELDLVLKIVADKKDPEKFKVKDLMTPLKDLISIEPNKTIFDAMILMKDNDVRRIPVMTNNELRGLITMKDVLGVEPDLLEKMVDVYE